MIYMIGGKKKGCIIKMTDKQINPNLRKLAELTYNPNLKTPNLDEILENKDSSVSDITEICKGFEEFMELGDSRGRSGPIYFR